MELFIIAALTTDGFIARTADSTASTTWTSKADTARFVRLTKSARVAIMGSSTFKTFPKPLKDRLNIVYSRSMTAPTEAEMEEGRRVEVTSASPAELVKSLAERGYESAAVCGGAEIYSLFMKSGFVTKMYLTIEPVLFGQGVSLFKNAIPGGVRLELLSSESVENSLFQEYAVHYA